MTTSFQRIYDRIAADIERCGQSILGVFGDVDHMPFAYTIGNTQRGLPELLIVAPVRFDALQSILNHVSATLVDAAPLSDGAMISAGGTFPLKARRAGAEARREYTIQAGQYYGHDGYEVFQLLLCDTQGRYPGERGCARPYADQPLVN